MNRLRAGMTQAELARAIGTTQSHVSEYESGARRIETMPAGEFVRLKAVPDVTDALLLDADLSGIDRTPSRRPRTGSPACAAGFGVGATEPRSICSSKRSSIWRAAWTSGRRPSPVPWALGHDILVQRVGQHVERPQGPRVRFGRVGHRLQRAFEPAAQADQLDFLPRLKAGDSYSVSLMGHRGSVGSRFMGDGVAAGRGQSPSHIASTGV